MARMLNNSPTKDSNQKHPRKGVKGSFLEVSSSIPQDSNAWLDNALKPLEKYSISIAFERDLATVKSQITKHLKQEVLRGQIKIIANILVYQATGKKRIGLSRTGVVSLLADLQAQLALEKELRRKKP